MKDNKIYDELDKELKDAFRELKMTYKHLEKLSSDINNIFKAKKTDVEIAKAMNGLKAYTQRIDMAKDKFDQLFAGIRALFKIRFGLHYDGVIEESVIMYCKEKRNYVELFINNSLLSLTKFEKYYIK